jgi:ABC-type transport system substrate-binding protein
MKSLSLLIFIILLSCAKDHDRSDTIDISVPGEVSSIDPASCFDAICFYPVGQMYESLYEFEYLKRPYQIRPLLAESLPQITNDRMTYVFKIKRGIKYHTSPLIPEGRELKAQDFINQIKRLAFHGTNSRGWWLFDGKIKGLNEWRDLVKTDLEKFFTVQVEGLQATDDYTLTIKLTRPYPQLPYAMSLTLTAPIPEEAIRASKNDFSQQEVGTGPYLMTNYNSSQIVEFEKFNNYSSSTFPTVADDQNLLRDADAKLPFTSKVKVHVIKESQTDWLNFLKKKIDLINLTHDQFHLAIDKQGKLQKDLVDQGIELQTPNTLTMWWIAFNLNDPLVGKNLNLRKAIAHAINIDEYISLFTFNVALKANSIYPIGIPGHNSQKQLPYKYDLELAKKYLKEAGYPEGKGLPVLRYDLRGSDTRRRQMGEYVQQQLRKIGIEISISQNTFPGFIEKARKGELQLWQSNWVMDYPDAENILQLLSSQNLPPGQNYFNFSNKKFDSFFMELSQIEDGSRKFELMNQMEDLVHVELPWIMQYYSRNYVLSHPELKNFMYSDIIYNYPKYLKKETHKN